MMTRRDLVTRAAAIQADADAIVAPAADVPPLPVLCDTVGRRARAIASSIDRAGIDLAGTRGDLPATRLALGHQDVWRFEAEVRRAIRDLTELADDVAQWRAYRDADVAAAT